MTPKELLYIEDALGHAKYLRCKCKAFHEVFQSSLRRTKYERSRYNGEPASNH